MGDERAAARRESLALTAWARDQAFPLWWERGVDRAGGGFYEALNQSGEPVQAPRRARVQARQIYAFCAAPALGWSGPADAAVEHGLQFFLERYRRPDGLFRTLVSPDGRPLEERVTLYDQAFALFALAAAHRALGSARGLEHDAVALREALRKRLSHPQGGFEIGDPAGLPLQSNPHMHLFEAALAWSAAGGDDGWAGLADEIAALALARFIDPDIGALREFFDADWRPACGADGRIVEPGHQFEWAWLLLEWGAARRRADVTPIAQRLIEIGEGAGVDRSRNVAVNALLDDMSVHDGGARLWPQTERTKAGALGAQSSGGDRFWRIAAEGAAGLRQYLQTPVPGLWRDRLGPDGRFVEEAAPASSFYHIVCAIAELQRCVA